MKKKILYGLLILLVVIQFIRPDRNLSSGPYANDITTKYAVPAPVAEVLKTSCFDCHSNLTTWPWYSSVAPVSWFVINHVNDGRRRLNFSEWEKPQRESFAEVEQAIHEGDMPIWNYTLMHREASLSPTETQQLIDGLRATDGRRTVMAEGGHFRGRYLLQADIAEFAADYSRGGSAPTVRVSLHGELGRAGERQVLANVAGSATVVAVADRRREVVAAFQAAFDAALASLVGEVDASISRAEPAGP